MEESFELVCRFCLGRDQVKHHIFVVDRLYQKISACLPLKVSEADNLPKMICDSCAVKIDHIFDYCAMAKSAERELVSGMVPVDVKCLPKNGLHLFAGTPHRIKFEPSDSLDPFEAIANDRKHGFISQCTQTDFDDSVPLPMGVKEELLIPDVSLGSPAYSSDDDLTLNDVAKMSIDTLKPENTEKTSSPWNEIVKKSHEDRPKKPRGRPRGSTNSYRDETKPKRPRGRPRGSTSHLNKVRAAKNKDDTNWSDIDESKLEELGEKLLQCLTCFALLGSRVELLQHYKDHVEGPLKAETDSQDLIIKCEEDNEKAGEESEQKSPNFVSIKTETGTKFQCLKCTKSYENKQHMIRHLISHDESRPFLCNICGRGYKRAYEILLHGRAHSGLKTLVCPFELCGYSTVYRGALLSHQKRHEPDYKYKCEICNKGFDVLTWFNEHQNSHTGVKPFSCEVCGKCFMYSRYLSSHRRTVHPETLGNKPQIVYRCEECDLVFPYRKKLQRHRANVHSGCGLPVLCDICGKKLSSKEHLKFHRRIHTGEKPHACRTCGKAFVKKCNMILHERIHTGEKPHVCSHCGKAFSQRSTLVIHERYHSGARPYQCEHCKKGFVAKGLLSMHQKTCI